MKEIDFSTLATKLRLSLEAHPLYKWKFDER